MPNSPQAPRAKTGKSGAPNSASNRSNAGRKYSERQAAKERAAREARRARNRTLGVASVVLVAVIVVALVLVKVAGGGSDAAGTSPKAGTPVPAAQVAKLTSVPQTTLASAPTNVLVVSPQKINDPALVSDGKPELLFIGAEFCPICAAERWPMYVALSKFGTFSPPPGKIHSAVRDGDLADADLLRDDVHQPVSDLHLGGDHDQPTRWRLLRAPRDADRGPAEALVGAHQRTPSRSWTSGGSRILTSAQYNPGDLSGVSFDNIVSDIGDNSTVVGADVDAAANVLIKTICSSLTGNKPADVCSATGDG